MYLYFVACRLIGDWPNTYTFTKALAEDLVKSMCKREENSYKKKIYENNNNNFDERQEDMMPVAVFRPAIVIPTYKEPVSGWIDVSLTLNQ